LFCLFLPIHIVSVFGSGCISSLLGVRCRILPPRPRIPDQLIEFVRPTFLSGLRFAQMKLKQRQIWKQDDFSNVVCKGNKGRKDNI